MLHKLDMPSFLANGIDHQASFTKSPPLDTYQHSGLDETSPTTNGQPGSWSSTASPILNGGLNGSISSLPNGDGERGRERAPSFKGSMMSVRSKKSVGLDNEKKMVDQTTAVKQNTPVEDGYFFPTTNGGPTAPAKSPTLKPAPSVASDALSATSGKSVHSAQLSTSSALPPVSEQDPMYSFRPSTDGMLDVPYTKHPHRASSPPAFNNASASSSSPVPLPQPNPNRLMHRHTLEVPKPAGRTSRDGMADDTGISSARTPVSTPNRRRGSAQLVRRATRSIHSDLYLDEYPQDEEAAKWAEKIKAKRASKRKRDDDDDRVVVGTKVDQNHVNWVTAYNMLTGIRFTVSRTNAKIDRDLTDADFSARHKFSFDITGNELTPSAKYDFKFKDYSPWVFRHLRNTFSIDPADYLVSLTSKYILSELGSPGKSGSFFYFSRDYRYIIKTIHHAEHKYLRKILREYYDHVQSNPNTLLSQFYGLHRVKIPYGRKIHFVVMNNLFPPHRDIHRTFDLKGSTIGRDFREEDLEKNPRATLKDLNWLRRNLHLEFGPTKKQAFVEQMQRDVALLQRLKIMDYSLLVGIHDLERGNEENLRDKTLQVFQPGGDKAPEGPQPNFLMRTPSKLENARKAKELRQLIKNEKPIPMDKTSSKMPDEMHDTDKRGTYFYADDGGFRATHEDDMPGGEIYYLGIIDCLTKYNYIKKAEHFFKSFGSPESQISAVPPERYGDRFVKFISGMTKSRERAEAEKELQAAQAQTDEASGVTMDSTHAAIQEIEGTVDDPKLKGVNMLKNPTGTNSQARRGSDPLGTNEVLERAQRQAEKSRRYTNESEVPDRSISAVRSPDVSDRDMVTLPVIGEAAETGSRSSVQNSAHATATVTPQASKDGLRNERSPLIGDADMTAQTIGEVPPPTPPKTADSAVGTNGGAVKANGRVSGDGGSRPRNFSHPKTPPRVDKELPLPPAPSALEYAGAAVGNAKQRFSLSPSRADEDEMGDLRKRMAEM